MSEAPRHQFYGRRKSRPLRGGRKDALETIYPHMKIEDPRKALDFPFKLEGVWLEIGFGNGDSLARWHREHPQIAFIGCEPFINGVSNFCKLVRDDDIKNLRIWNDIAQPLIDALPDACLDRVYLLNSDPWPKKRHHRRRFIQQDSLTTLARIMKKGATLTMTTDHALLGEWMLEQACRHPAFEWTATCDADWLTPPDGWLTTRYEGKGADAGRRQVYLIFRRI